MSEDKIIDDIKDLVNYCYFLFCRLRNRDDVRASRVEFIVECFNIIDERKDTYSDAWKLMKIEELAAGIALKAGRINALAKLANSHRRPDIQFIHRNNY